MYFGKVVIWGMSASSCDAASSATETIELICIIDHQFSNWRFINKLGNNKQNVIPERSAFRFCRAYYHSTVPDGISPWKYFLEFVFLFSAVKMPINCLFLRTLYSHFSPIFHTKQHYCMSPPPGPAYFTFIITWCKLKSFWQMWLNESDPKIYFPFKQIL